MDALGCYYVSSPSAVLMPDLCGCWSIFLRTLYSLENVLIYRNISETLLVYARAAKITDDAPGLPLV
jgi:hypothetical protein